VVVQKVFAAVVIKLSEYMANDAAITPLH